MDNSAQNGVNGHQSDNEDDLANELNNINVEDDQFDEECLVDESQLDDAEIVFSLHDGSVFVVDTDQSGSYAVSGGEDDKAFVWDIKTGDLLFEIKAKDSITCASFSADSALVAAGDMSGLIQVWKIDTKEEIWQFETADLEWLAWHPVVPILMAGTQDGDAWMWKIPSGDSKTFQSPGCPCSCGKILPDGKSAVLCYGDGSIRIYDLKTQNVIHSITKGKHSHYDGVNHVTSSGDGQVVITGSLDGSAKLISSTSGKVTATYIDHEQTDDDDDDKSVEHVGYSNSLSLVAVVSLNRCMTIWDVKTSQIRTRCKHPDGVTRILWDSRGMFVYTGCLDGICRKWNARSGDLMRTFVGHVDQIYDIILTKNDKFLLSASADGTVRVFDTEGG